MSHPFRFDVFVSCSSKDTPQTRPLAKRLRADGLQVWFHEWSLNPVEGRDASTENGLEQSRVLLLCMSANAFGSDWAQLEATTFRFRDPLNRERRFIPLRLDEAPIKESLQQLPHINWLPPHRDEEYPKLLNACSPQPKLLKPQPDTALNQAEYKAVQIEFKGQALGHIQTYAFSPDGRRVLWGGDYGRMQIWNLDTGQCLRVFEGHKNTVMSVAWSADERRALSAVNAEPCKLWDAETGKSLSVLGGSEPNANTVVFSADGRRTLSVDAYGSISLWNVETVQPLCKFESFKQPFDNATLLQPYPLALSADGHRALSGAGRTVQAWDVDTGQCLRVFEGHRQTVESVAWSADERRALSGSCDYTVRVWDVDTGQCLRVLEGHENTVQSVAWSADGHHTLSGSADNTVRVWDVDTGRCLRVFEGHKNMVQNVAWSADGRRALSGDAKGGIRVWDLSEVISPARVPEATTIAWSPPTEQILYTNAKVVLVGDSGSGKTGLSMRLAHDDWKPTDSTVGAWATQWKIPALSAGNVEREIWLWDFGGQADQRLIHQLYMEEAALAVLVFDGQKEDLFETLAQWDRELMRASGKRLPKVLVAGRVDAGGLRVSREQIERFAKEHGFYCFLETSSKANIGCKDLKDAVLAAIQWENIPWRSSPLLFRRLKDEILRLKEAGRVLMRFNELRDTLLLRLAGEGEQFTNQELEAVVRLLAGPGVVWELAFGSLVLLQPETINAYAQAAIRTLRADDRERGCITEERVLSGDLSYPSSIRRLGTEEERFVLLAMQQTLVERGLCLREPTDSGAMLIFPSYYRRERPELGAHPAVLVTYRFKGFLDDIYTTLVVRLHHTKPFGQDQLWRYAADFKTLTGKELGLKLVRLADGAGELQLYFDPAISIEEKIIFTRYVHEHLLEKGQDVVRLRHYVCPYCKTPVASQEVAMKRLGDWLGTQTLADGAAGPATPSPTHQKAPSIVCVECESRVPLWDELEQCFASRETQERVRKLQLQSAIVLDSQSRERVLVGEVMSTVALAGQISREFTVSDHGIDMEIEFKDDAGNATGRKVYLQLKSGDSHLRNRRRDDTEIFTIKDERHSLYWMAQAFPVMLVIRNSQGEVHWMEVRDWLKRASENGNKRVKQIAFHGERFDVMSVSRWRNRVLSG